MVCKLCKEVKEPKPNTHFFSDSLVKYAINEEGKGGRERGKYWGIDTSKNHVEFNFQRNVNIPKLEKLLGRQATEEENAKSMSKIEFSVSDSFCQECEDKFGIIEKKFEDNIFPKFRTTSLDNTTHVDLNIVDSAILRLYAGLQLWRGFVCGEDITLTNKLAETLRVKIYNGDDTELEGLAISCTYLQTKKVDEDINDDSYKTGNSVLANYYAKTNHLLLNDFLFQTTEDFNFPFDNFFGFNDEDDYVEKFNLDSQTYTVKIIPDEQRRVYNYNYQKFAAKKMMAESSWRFLDEFTNRYKRLPTDKQISHYLIELSEDEDLLKFEDGRLKVRAKLYFKRIDNGTV